MEVELLEIRDFLADHPPFDQLPEDAINELTEKSTIRYLRRGREFPPDDDKEIGLYMVRQGAISLFDEKKNLAEKLGEGDIFTTMCQRTGANRLSGETKEDTLVYMLTCNDVTALRKAHTDINAFFVETSGERLKDALSSIKDGNVVSSALMTMTVGEVIKKEPVVVARDTTIQEAAKKMSEFGVSSLIIMDGPKLAGILTDRDIRKRCIAAGLSPQSTVSEIMTTGIRYIQADAPTFDALMMMTRNHVHHLPVCDNGVLSGMITTTDLVRHESANAVYLTGTMRKAESLDVLIESSKKLPELQLQLINSGATAQHVGRAVTAVTDSITCRLIELAQEKLGPAPVPFAWVAGGSQARREQSAHSDQDNALIISDTMSKEDDAYFAELAKFVCDGLNECGYIYCPGNVMATNSEWRQTQSTWFGYFQKWINSPEPMALMLSSVFFDLRLVYGDTVLLDEIRDDTLRQSKANKIFIAYMVGNALKHRPPLGFFRDFVLIHDGEHDNTLDLKHNGIVPIVDLARIFALAEGIRPNNSIKRLTEARGSYSLSDEGGADLLDALEFIATLRMQHQAGQIRRGEQPDNFLPPTNLSKLEREHLKDAFKVIHGIQETLAQRYQSGRFV